MYFVLLLMCILFCCLCVFCFAAYMYFVLLLVYILLLADSFIFFRFYIYQYIAVFLLDTVIYVFLLLGLYILIVQLPWLRFFRAFSSVVRQMPGYNSPRRGTSRTVPITFLCCLMYCFCVVLCIVFCCSMYCFCVVLCIVFVLFYVLFFVLFYVLFLCCSVYCLCVTVYCTAVTGCQPNCS
jgi:hypothetical protein